MGHKKYWRFCAIYMPMTLEVPNQQTCLLTVQDTKSGVALKAISG
jgi:hypothetical protein